MSATIRAVRQARGLRAADLARLMGMEPRTYSRFETGEVQPDLDKLLIFAEATDSDPIALVASVVLDRPDLAAACIDSKLAMIQVLALERFLSAASLSAPQVDGASFISVMEAAFDELAKEAAARSAFTRSWLGRVVGSFRRRPGV